MGTRWIHMKERWGNEALDKMYERAHNDDRNIAAAAHWHESFIIQETSQCRDPVSFVYAKMSVRLWKTWFFDFRHDTQWYVAAHTHRV